MDQVMLDLETMGTRPGSAIVAIGAVKFDLDTGTLGPTFYQVISLQSCLSVGLKIQASTVYWWLKQNEKARGALQVNPKNISDVLKDFSEWFKGSDFIWGHGASFDPVLLESAYTALKQNAPWDYKNIRDTRTLFELSKAEVPRDLSDMHHALNDAVYQAKVVIASRGQLWLKGI